MSEPSSSGAAAAATPARGEVADNATGFCGEGTTPSSTCSGAASGCSSNAFATMFRMARASSARNPSPAASATSVQSAPELASMERDRVIPSKRPAERRIAVAGKHKRLETGVSLQQRISEYRGESFVVSAGELKCRACGKTVQNIKSTIDLHVASKTHKEKVEALNARVAADADLRTELITHYTEQPGESGASTHPDEKVFQIRVVESFLRAGIPLQKVDMLRPLLERTGYSLTASTHLSSLIPKVEAMEMARLLAELDGQRCSLAFDGTTRLGEALNIVARFCTEGFVLEQRLVRFLTLARHADGAALAGVISSLVLQQLRMPIDSIVGFLRDSAAVNGSAIGMLGMFTSAANIMCVSHTLNNVGSRFSFSVLSTFSSAWVTLMHSHAARGLWAGEIGHSPRRYSAVRWHALAEMQFEIGTHFSRLDDFLQQCTQHGIAPSSTSQLQTLLQTDRHTLRLQLAAMLDMRCLVSATYDLEGDRLEILLVHDRIMSLMDIGARLRRGDVDGLLPNLHAVLRADSTLQVGVMIDKVWPGMGVYEGRVDRVSRAQSDVHTDGRVATVYRVSYPADGTQEELEDEEIRPLVRVRELPEHVALVRDCLVPAFDYLEQRFASAHAGGQYSCAQQMQMYAAIRVFNPSYAASVQLTGAHVDALAVVTPIARLCSLPALKAELPAYVAAVAGVVIPSAPDIAAFTEQVLTWWRVNASRFPAWACAARIVFALSPNSASCERVFSLLESMFGDAQTSALADYLQASLMLAYNGRRM